MGRDWEERIKDNEFRNFILNLMEDLKTEIIQELKVILKQGQIPNLKKWVKSVDVKKLLNISHGKLQTMRNSRTITFTKVGGTIYYNIDDIQRMMEQRSRKR
ncbi:helix-turn-helix domain-containing protein [Fluviicola sp.]|uniref:helix-turn-helix domain-containing protein n=1 Tax=Fluviicola sp. TaxID=1917219 RepID=UPI0031D5040B